MLIRRYTYLPIYVYVYVYAAKSIVQCLSYSVQIYLTKTIVIYDSDIWIVIIKRDYTYQKNSLLETHTKMKHKYKYVIVDLNMVLNR